jgi:hypothetical protein
MKTLALMLTLSYPENDLRTVPLELVVMKTRDGTDGSLWRRRRRRCGPEEECLKTAGRPSVNLSNAKS